MSAPGPNPESDPSLNDFSGAVVLVGAGKMGGALLEGWLKLGLDPRHVAVLEPRPSPEIAALATRGLRLNPDLRTLPSAAAFIRLSRMAPHWRTSGPSTIIHRPQQSPARLPSRTP